MPEYREWVTVEEAAAIAERKPRTIYEWIQQERVSSRKGKGGVLLVNAEMVARTAQATRRGRPGGIPTRR